MGDDAYNFEEMLIEIEAKRAEIEKLRAGIRTAVLDIQDGYTKIALKNLKALNGGDDEG